MFLLAESDSNTWAVIIGAVFLGAGQILQIYLSHRRALAAKKQLQRTSSDVKKYKEEVKVYKDETLRECDIVKKMVADAKQRSREESPPS